MGWHRDVWGWISLVSFGQTLPAFTVASSHPESDSIHHVHPPIHEPQDLVKTPKKEKKEKSKDKEGKKKKEKSKRSEEGAAADEAEQPKVCMYVCCVSDFFG